MSEMIDGLIF